MKIHQLVKEIEKLQLEKRKSELKYQLPQICIGDTVKVDVLIQEILKGDEKKKKDEKKTVKERIQSYEGTVIAHQKEGFHTNITVRRIFQGVGVERIFSIYSPSIQRIQIIKRAKVRRAKLYYLRNRVGKATRLKEKN